MRGPLTAAARHLPEGPHAPPAVHFNGGINLPDPATVMRVLAEQFQIDTDEDSAVSTRSGMLTLTSRRLCRDAVGSGRGSRLLQAGHVALVNDPSLVEPGARADVDRERGLARAGDSGEDDEVPLGDVEVDTGQVVLAAPRTRITWTKSAGAPAARADAFDELTLSSVPCAGVRHGGWRACGPGAGSAAGAPFGQIGRAHV